MTNLDKKLIQRKLEALGGYLRRLSQLKNLNKDTYLADDRNYGLAEHYMQLAIETLLDISRHLIISLALNTPDDNYGIFPELTKAGILTENFTKRNAQMIGFRNRLVHVYESIDHKKTYDYLQEHLADFQQFIKEISQYLLKQKELK